SGFFAIKNRIQVVPKESQLCKSGYNGRPGYEFVDGEPTFHECEFSESIVPARYAINAHEMHGEKYQVCTNKGYPEMQVAKLFIHHSPVHFREPMINACKHTEDRGTSHHK